MPLIARRLVATECRACGLGVAAVINHTGRHVKQQFGNSSSIDVVLALQPATGPHLQAALPAVDVVHVGFKESKALGVGIAHILEGPVLHATRTSLQEKAAQPGIHLVSQSVL